MDKRFVVITREDRSLASGDWHVRSVGNQNGSLHDGSGFIVDCDCLLKIILENSSMPQMPYSSEVSKNLSHFVSTLATTHVDDDVRVAVLRDRLGNHLEITGNYWNRSTVFLPFCRLRKLQGPQ